MVRNADFCPAWWLPGPHFQTLWAAVCRRKPSIPVRRERVELPDGDFIDLDWNLRENGPIVLILHGLEGSSNSQYARGLLAAVSARGWRGVVMHFRGCSGEPNRLDRYYNAGDTGDIAYIVDLLHRREPSTFLACVGYSLGGNALLKWLGETSEKTRLKTAVAVSVPFLLDAVAKRMGLGVSRIYEYYLINNLQASYRRKFRDRPNPPVALEEIPRLRHFFTFDDKVTAPLHGYAGAYDYYGRASSRQYLKGITVPTLILHAADDPFMVPSVIPTASELSDRVILEISPRGGHVGFVAGPHPWRAEYWLERRIPAFLAEHFECITKTSTTETSTTELFPTPQG